MLLAGLGLLLAPGIVSAQGSSGPELAGRLGCFACHALNGRGGTSAAALDGVGARLTPAQLDTILTYPRQIHPRAKMPSYAYLPARERQALAEFLQKLE
jgi:mono/diheme cytochrome c family protein